MSGFSPNALLQKLDNALAQDNVVNKYLNKIQNATGINKRYIAIIVIAFVSVYLVYGYAADLLCNLIGFVYPAYISVKAIESKDKDDDTEWLMYWVVFAVFSVVEFFSDILLSWFPFYFLGKCVFLLWCMAPIPGNGSSVIYYNVIKPFVNKHEKDINKVIDAVKEEASEMVSQGLEAVKEKSQSHDDVLSGVASKLVAGAVQDSLNAEKSKDD